MEAEKRGVEVVREGKYLDEGFIKIVNFDDQYVPRE